MEIDLDNFFTIGEISKISQISIRMLRHYDKIGLLKPAYVDPDNNYRYYSEEQVLLISFIKELRYQNFKFDEIKNFFKLNDGDTVAELFQNKIKEIEEKQNRLEKSKNRLLDFLDQYEIIRPYNTENKSGENKIIKFKKLDSRLIAYTRYDSSFTTKSFLVRFAELQSLIVNNDIQMHGPYMAIFYDDYLKLDLDTEKTDLEVCVCINVNDKDNYNFVREIPKGLFLTATYKDADINETKKVYSSLMEFITKNKYKVCGPTVKLYYYRSRLKSGSERAISELQIPVKKS